MCSRIFFSRIYNLFCVEGPLYSESNSSRYCPEYLHRVSTDTFVLIFQWKITTKRHVQGDITDFEITIDRLEHVLTSPSNGEAPTAVLIYDQRTLNIYNPAFRVRVRYGKQPKNKNSVVTTWSFECLYFKKIRTQTNYDIKKCIFKKIKLWLNRNSVCLSRLEVIFSKLYWIWFLRNLHCVSFKFTTECRSNLVHAIVSIIRAEKRLNRKNQQVIQQFLF